jgi:hypothetical protein
MGQRNVLRLLAYDEPYTVVVEPWANEFPVRVGEECQVVALHHDVIPTFGVELGSGRLIVWVSESGSTFEFWRAGTRELAMPVPIPSLPSGTSNRAEGTRR